VGKIERTCKAKVEPSLKTTVHAPYQQVVSDSQQFLCFPWQALILNYSVSSKVPPSWLYKLMSSRVYEKCGETCFFATMLMKTHYCNLYLMSVFLCTGLLLMHDKPHNVKSDNTLNVCAL